MRLANARFPFTLGGLVVSVALHAGVVITSEYTAPYFGIPRLVEQSCHAIILLLLFGVYGLAVWRLIQGHTLRLRHLVLVLVLSAAPYLINYATQSADLYVYIAYAEISQEGNPYLNGPVSLDANHPILHGIWKEWKPYPAPYGPLWMLISAGIGKLHASLGLQLALFKLFGAGIFAMIIALLVRWRSLPVASMIVLNPLFLIEFVGDAHNDGLFTLLILLSVIPFGRPALSGLALGLSIATKHVSLVISPLIAVAYARGRQYWRAVAAAASTLGTLVVLYAAMWAGPQTFDGIRSVGQHFFAVPLFFPQKIILGILKNYYPDLSRQSGYELSAYIGLLIFLLCLGWFTWRVWRQRATLPEAAFYVLCSFIFFGLQWVQSWYFTWPLVLTAFLKPKISVRAIGVITVIWFVSMYTTF